MDSGQDKTETTLAESVEYVIKNLSGDVVTLREILDVIGREGMLVFCIFLTLPFMVPISIPGVSTVFGLVIGLIGFGIMTHRTPWLPDRLMRKKLPADRLRLALEHGTVWIHRLGRISRPSIPVLTHGMGMTWINGLMLIAGALLLMAPFGLIPFSNTLPGLAILFLAIGVLQRDGRSVLLGYMTLVVTVLYFAFLLLGGFTVLQGMIEWVRFQ
ncbi:MAG: exopolysaccharide biosynthesis protein [Syntrophobacteraceae bacterium]